MTNDIPRRKRVITGRGRFSDALLFGCLVGDLVRLIPTEPKLAGKLRVALRELTCHET